MQPGGMDSIADFIHKEKNQKKYNKTKGQLDDLKKYTTTGQKASDKLTTDKQMSKSAVYVKNHHIDNVVMQLQSKGLLSTEYGDFYYWVCHQLGASFVQAQAYIALEKGREPAALFHWLINKELKLRNLTK